MSSGFRRNFLKLSAGTFIAQVLSFLVMPIVSRLYLPEEMGEYALYVSISSIVGLVSNLRMDQALVVGRNNEEAENLAWVGFGSALVLGLITFLVMSGIYGLTVFSVCTALSTFCIGANQTLAQWHNRHQHYETLSRRNVGEKMVVLSFSVALGIWGFTQWGLIAAQTGGLIFSLGFFFWTSGLKIRKNLTSNPFKVARAFLDFPTLNVVSSLALALAFFLPNILFAHYFSRSDLGHYNLVARLFDVPIFLIAYTFNTVYYQHTSQLTSSVERVAIFKKSLFWLGAGLTPPFLLIAFFALPFVTYFFGEPWAPAAFYAVWLAPYTLLRLLYVSQSALLLVLRNLRLEMILSVTLFVSQVAGFYLGLYLNPTPLICVAWMCGLGSVVYVMGLLWIRQALK